MATSWRRGVFLRGGHVVAYLIAALAGYEAAGEVLSYFYERLVPDGEPNGNPFVGILRAILQGGFAVLFGVVAAVVVFVAIVGVGGAILSQAWGRLVPIILDRWSPTPEQSE